MQHSMGKGDEHAQRAKRCRGVVAQVFRVAEDEAGSMPVVQIPEAERHDGQAERPGRGEMLSIAAPEGKPQFPYREGKRSDNGRLLRQHGQ